MNSNLLTKRIATLAAAAIVGASMLSPAMAAMQDRGHVRAAPYAQQQGYAQEQGYGQQRAPFGSYGNAYNQAPSDVRTDQSWNFGQGNRCVTDEGYGRWSYCDGGGN
ncbi:hypothetical protein RA307_20775 [Xanthobacteraceae bacterium Astr-EGSB]|uniref:hypothetical protein n=1 Tax=Astrobacterium formosum TaxID=3069710 RepID=UPI0027B078E0|nr:hypothetical protein [Xanthobacteraceae bacterium Astr-EGSB]